MTGPVTESAEGPGYPLHARPAAVWHPQNRRCTIVKSRFLSPRAGASRLGLFSRPKTYAQPRWGFAWLASWPFLGPWHRPASGLSCAPATGAPARMDAPAAEDGRATAAAHCVRLRSIPCPRHAFCLLEK